MGTIRMSDLPTEQSAEGAYIISVNSQGESVKIPSSAVGGGGTITTDPTPTANSTNPVQSGGVKTYVDSKIGDINTILESVVGGN